MRKFVVNVNGKSYEVEVEEVKEEGMTVSGQENRPAPKSSAKPARVPATKTPVPEAKDEKNPIEVSAEQEAVKSPMPGNIWKITSKKGEEIKAGDVLLILEAMKMENEIVAPRDGVVSSIMVQEGATVNTGDDLVILD